MIDELNHLGILVRDMGASLEFYERLDARVVFRHDGGDGVRLAYLQIAGGMIELVEVPAEQAAPQPRYGIDHLAFVSDDLDRDCARLVEAGCTVDGAAAPGAGGPGRRVFFRRPDGARIELVHREDDFRTRETPGVVAAFDHFAYEVEDLHEARRFVGEVLGMPHTYDLRTGEGDVIRSFFTLDEDVLGLRAGVPEPGRPFPHFALRVGCMDRAVRILGERGIAPVEPPESSPSGRRAFLADPDGVRIALLDRPDPR